MLRLPVGLGGEEEEEEIKEEEGGLILDEKVKDYIRSELSRGRDVHVDSIVANFNVTKGMAQRILDDCIRSRVLSQRPDAVPIRAFQAGLEDNNPRDIEMVALSSSAQQRHHHPHHHHHHHHHHRKKGDRHRDVNKKTSRKAIEDEERRQFEAIDDEADDHNAFMAKMKEFLST